MGWTFREYDHTDAHELALAMATAKFEEGIAQKQKARRR